jgi:glycosyltransferase involved in cell wall biosynthesis
MPTCDILLAAYNGVRYGPALLDSLLAQTYEDFTLVVRDDGSTDATVQMLMDYAPRFGGRMRLIEGGAPTGSAMGNFSILMQASQADYVLCADIDDVWLPTKVADTLALLRGAEQEFGPTTPIYVFTDVTPVNARLEPLADSFWAFKKIDPAISQSLSQSLVCPAMLGCASGMNRALVRMASPVPPSVTGHDWWALLVALTFGAVRYSPARTMFYRLHGANQSDQKRVNVIDYLRRKNPVRFVRHGMGRRRAQAQALIDRFDRDIKPDERQVIASFVATADEGFVLRRLSLLKGGYLYPDWQRNLAMLIGV